MSIAQKLIDIAERIPILYNEGKRLGVIDGRESERQTFWYDFQEGGNRTAYNNAFQNVWTDAMFNPVYNMNVTNAGYMFSGTKITNLKKLLEDNGVKLDFSKATSMDRTFASASKLTHLPIISTVSASASHTQNLFYDCKSLISIEKLILKDDGSQTFNDNSFKNCNELEEIRIEGVIGNTINFQWSKKLSMMSLASIVGALSKTSTGQTITFPTTARTTYDSATISGAWDNLVAMYPNWTFKYA